MAITPNGSPAWVRASDHTTYGGDLNKENWKGVGVVNPKTDVGAEAFTRLVCDVAALTRVAPFAVITLLMDDVTPANPTVETCELMTGVRSSSYAGGSPPSGFPTVTRIADGRARVQFSSSYTDPYGVSGALTILSAKATAQDTVSTNATAVADAANYRVDVYAWTSSTGAAATSKRVTVTVY